MTYTINKSDGNKLVDILDGTIDQITDLKLIGKNSTSFGEALNENLVYLLENFSNTTPPDRPLTGQIWYNTSKSRLEVYSGNVSGWRPAGSPIVQSSQPLQFVSGDLWINDTDKQLYFYDGNTLTLAGPLWTKGQGITGVIPKTIYDDNDNAKTILQLYVKDTILGIYSSEEFTVSTSKPLTGFTSIVKGYNSNSTVATTFDIKSVDSQKLNGLSGNSYLRSDNAADNNGFANTRSIMSVPLTVQSQDGISIGLTSNANFYISGQSGRTLNIENTSSDISLRTFYLDKMQDNLYIQAASGRVGISTTSPSRTLDINGSARVRGNFEVDGKILTVPIELTLIDNDIVGYPTVTLPCTGTIGERTLTITAPATTTGIHQDMIVFGPTGIITGLGNNPVVQTINSSSEIALTVTNSNNVAKTLTFLDPTIREKTKLILTDVAPPHYYMPNQLALVHYQHINGNTITRYLKRFIVGTVVNLDGSTFDEWQFDSDLTSSV